MSRKTRKLIWSAPLVAVLAVAGALAIFAALSPQEATAHEAVLHGAPNPVTGLDASVATGNDANGQPAGRTQINLTWMAPEASTADMTTGAVNAGLATSYRIDYSDNTRVWRNLLGGESGEAALMDTMADSNCAADAADGMRCFTDMTLTPGKLRHYRVFAMNDQGTSPVSIQPTYVTATTNDYTRPSAARLLTATTSLVDSIVLNWQSPTDLGGATLLWYCIAVGATEAAVPDLTADAAAPDCLNETEATEGDVAVGEATIVVPADMTTYTQGELDDPAIISQWYRVYAVTDRDGEADTANDATATPAVTNERYISLAASNTANGRTVSPLPDVDTDVTATPDPVTNLRYVASRANGGTDVTLNLYWTLPANYPDAPAAGVTPDPRTLWRIEVERWDPASGDNGEFVTVAAEGTPVSPAQWTSTTNDQTLTLNTAEQLFQVRYVNDPNTTPDDSDDADGIVKRFRVPQTTPENYEAQDLPTIAVTSYTDPQTGLRFRHNEINPTTWLDLIWTADTPGDTDNNNTPTGYVIDYTEAAAIDQHTRWHSLPNARRPSDLGATTQYTHKGVTPGQKYTYRVFPEFGSHSVSRYDYRYGVPRVEEASSREADLPGPVLGLTVVANPDNPQTELKLSWNKLPDDPMGHPVLGYLVEVANDTDNDMTPPAADATWTGLPIQDDDDTNDVDESEPWSVDKDTLMYTYDGVAEGSALTTDDTLAGGYVRWFRVIAITAENDGDADTGGQAVDPATGAVAGSPSTGETTPNTAVQTSARPAKGMTDAPDAPDDPSQVMSPPMPEDLTSEKASDTNLLEPTSRGVLLLWNEPETTDGINAYVVQRKIDDGEWTPIARVTARTSYSDQREYRDGEDLQYRVGSLGASTVPPSYTDPVTYPTTHPEGHAVVLGAPTNVMASSDAARTLNLTWEGGENADLFVLVAYEIDTGDIQLSTELGTARMGNVTGLTPGSQYLGLVIAVMGSGADLESLYDYDRTDPITTSQ